MKKQYIMAAIIGVMLIFGMILTGCYEPEPKPDAPAEINAETMSSSSIKISWSIVSNVSISGYNLYRSTESKGTYTLLKALGGSTTSFADGGLPTGTTYYYKVSAYSKREGALSSAASATTYHAEIPTGINASVESKNSIMVSWNSVSGSGVKGYKVYRSSSADSPPSQLVTTITTTSYTDNSVNENTTYYYAVSAYSNSGESVQSSIVSAKTAVPEALVATSLTDDVSITLGWYVLPSTQGYKVYKSDSEDGTYTLLATVGTVSTIKDEEGRPIITYKDRPNLGATYYYKVCAYNKIGEGPLSEPEVKEALTNYSASWQNSIDSRSDYKWHDITSEDRYRSYQVNVGSVFAPKYETRYIFYTPYFYLDYGTGQVKAEIYDINLKLIGTMDDSVYYKMQSRERIYVKVICSGQTGKPGSYTLGINYRSE